MLAGNMDVPSGTVRHVGGEEEGAAMVAEVVSGSVRDTGQNHGGGGPAENGEKESNGINGTASKAQPQQQTQSDAKTQGLCVCVGTRCVITVAEGYSVHCPRDDLANLHWAVISRMLPLTTRRARTHAPAHAHKILIIRTHAHTHARTHPPVRTAEAALQELRGRTLPEKDTVEFLASQLHENLKGEVCARVCMFLRVFVFADAGEQNRPCLPLYVTTRDDLPPE